MTYLDETKAALDKILGSVPKIRSTDMAKIAPLINRAAALKLIESVLANEVALAAIASRSYTHTLGFRKLVLLDPGLVLPDGKIGYGYQLRLHIWEPGSDNGVPLVEAMHEHSFDFTSSMLTGTMENQCYTIVALSADEQLLVARLLVRLGQMQPADKIAANSHLEALESIRLAAFGSAQAAHEQLLLGDHRSKLRELLAVSDDQLDLITSLQGRYQSVASNVSTGGYVHRLTQMVKLQPHRVLKLEAGDTYHHTHPFAHRLYIRANQKNSTMIVTTPVSQDAMGGSFQRPTWVPGQDIEYARKMYTPDELRRALTDYRQDLAATIPTGNPGRFLNVA